MLLAEVALEGQRRQEYHKTGKEVAPLWVQGMAQGHRLGEPHPEVSYIFVRCLGFLD